METEPSPFGPGNPLRPSLRYLFLRFLRIGFLAWGGPVAQIGLMHREMVERDGWIDEARFRKTLALYQALPGPEAHELAVFLGVLKRGRWGGLVAGLGFMLPGVVLVTLLAALYVRYSETTTVADVLLYGVKPVVVALIAVAFLRLARASLTTPALAAIGLGAALAAFLVPTLNLVLLLAFGGLLAALLGPRVEPRGGGDHGSGGRGGAHAWLPLGLGAAVFPALTFTGLGALAVLSLKVGLLTFGGAYTAIPFLHESAVVEHGWITEDQFLDALGLSQMVPGPLIAIGTFVGYQAAGLAGAALATVLIFTPAFAFTLLGHEHFERLLEAPRLHAFLLGVTAAVVGLILVASWPLARSALVDLPSGAIALVAVILLHRRLVPIPFVIAGGAAAGWLAQLAS